MPPVLAAVGAVIGAISGAVAAVAGVVSSLGIIGSLALTAGLSLVGNLLKPKSKPPPARGSVTQINLDPDAPQPYVMGEGLVGGALRHDAAYGATLDEVPNPFRFMVLSHSGGGPVEEIAPRLDQQPIDMGYYGAGPWLGVDSQLGACPEADALVAVLNGDGLPGWSTSSKLSGEAATAWNLRFDREGKVFASGVPQLGAYGKWVKVYDPRHDSTFPGGSGSHRLGDESTYEWSENPALHAGTYAYGRYQNGKRTIGVGLPADAVDWPNIAAWANVCDANAWRLFGIVYEPDDRWQNLKDIAAAGGGVPLIAGGILSFHYSAPRISLETITEADISEADMTVTAMQSWRDRLNTIIPKYRSPEHNWELISADAVAVPTYVAEDGEIKRSEWPFNFVKDVDQAAQLARYVLEDGRELQPIEITCHPRFHALRPGDCVDLDLPNLGLDTPAVILRREFDPANLTVKFILIGETAAKHAYALGQTTTPPPTPAIGQSSEDRDQVSGAVLIGQPGSPGADGADGADGLNGLNNALVYIYKRSITTPTLPTTTATYTFATGGLTGQNNGWSRTIPAADGNPLWITAATASSTGATDTVAAGEWAAPVVLAQDGAPGNNGLNAARVDIYKRSAAAPSLPGTTATYVFATGALTGQNNGWTTAVPAADGNPLYTSFATASGTGASDTIASTEWVPATIVAQDGAAGSPGAPGAPGAAGLNNAVVALYQRAASAPPAPSGTFTYNFATGSLTGGTPGGWTTAVPAADGNPLWIIAATASANTATDTITAAEFSSAVIDSGAGLNTATVRLYQRATSAPSAPAGTTTYTFATSVLSGALGSWSQTVPAGTNPLYTTQATAVSVGTTDTIATSEWAAPTIMAQDGATGSAGAAGLNNAIVFIYKRSGSAPALPTTTATFTFATGALSGQNNGWTTAVPAADGNPLYVSTAAASANTATDTISSAEWASPTVLVQDGSPGANGINTATVFLYRRTTTNSAPALPSTTSTYTFATGVLTGHNNSWVQSVPASSGGKYLWITTASALGTSATDTLASTEWATPNLMAQDGTNGADGAAGADSLTAEISVAAATVYAYADGTIVDFNTTYGKITLWQGTTDVTSSATLSIAGSTGVTGEINNAGNTPIGSSPKGAYRATGLTTDNGTLTISAVYGGVTFTRTVSLVRVKAGFEAVTSLPGTGNTEGRTVSMGGNLYVYTGGAWKRSTSQLAGANLLLGAIPGTNPNRYVIENWNPDGVPIQNLGVGGNVSSPNFGGFPGAQWTLPDQGTFATHQTNGTHGTTGVYDLKFIRPVNLSGGVEDRWNVEELKTYEFSVYSACHRCEADLLIIWYDATGNTEITPSVHSNKNSTTLTSNPPDGNSLSNYVRLVARGVAPAGAKVAKFILRKSNTTTGQGDSWAFWAHPMASEVPAGSTDTLPWSAPAQGLFYAETIVANSITANQLATSGLITNSAQINSAVIINGHIQDLSVSTLKIQDNAVTIPVSVYTPGFLNMAANSTWTTIQSLFYTTSGSKVLVNLGFLYAGPVSGASLFYVGLFRNGTLLFQSSLPLTAGFYNSPSTYSLQINDIPPAAWTQYELKLYVMSGNQDLGVYDRTISAIDVKK